MCALIYIYYKCKVEIPDWSAVLSTRENISQVWSLQNPPRSTGSMKFGSINPRNFRLQHWEMIGRALLFFAGSFRYIYILCIVIMLGHLCGIIKKQQQQPVETNPIQFTAAFVAKYTTRSDGQSTLPLAFFFMYAHYFDLENIFSQVSTHMSVGSNRCFFLFPCPKSSQLLLRIFNNS